MPSHGASLLPMLNADDVSIRVRRVIPAPFDTRNERGFRGLEPDADEGHRHVVRDTLDGRRSPGRA